MINFSEIEVDLKKLILEKQHTQYIKLFYSSFQQASTTEDINNLLVLLFQLEIEYKIYKLSDSTHQYKSFLLLIKRIICELLSQGVIPHQEYLHLYNIFSHFDFDKDQNITNLLTYFKKDIKTISWDNENIFIENNIIFLLEILNGNKKEALIQYTRNILLTNIHLGQRGLHCQFINMFSSSTDDFTIDVVLKSINFYLDSKIYFHLTINKKKSLFAWGYELLINSTKFTKNLQTKSLYPQLKSIIDILIQKNEVEELMSIEFFTMISQMTIYQKHEESEKFNTEITYQCGEAYQKFSMQNNLIQAQKYNNEKKKIAFIFERLVAHSPFKVVFSLLKQLQKEKHFREHYELEVYSLNYFLPIVNTKEIEKSLTDIGVKVIYPVSTYLELDNYSHRIERALKIRNCMIQNKVDIVIACFNSYDILNFLFASRTAPIQIFWSHNDGHYDVPGIDKRISHFYQSQSKFDFEIFTMPADIERYNPKVNMAKVKKIRESYPKECFVLGSIGRLIKIESDEYLETVAKIMEQNPNTIFLACGSGNQEKIKEKIKELNITDRFYFTGHIDAHIYAHIIDLYLDPFPLGGGEALMEYRGKGKPWVSLIKDTWLEENLNINFENEYLNNNINYLLKSLYSEEDLKLLRTRHYLINENKTARFYQDISAVQTIEEYISITSRLINDKVLCEKLMEEYLFCMKNSSQMTFLDLIQK